MGQQDSRNDHREIQRRSRGSEHVAHHGPWAKRPGRSRRSTSRFHLIGRARFLKPRSRGRGAAVAYQHLGFTHPRDGRVLVFRAGGCRLYARTPRPVTSRQTLKIIISACISASGCEYRISLPAWRRQLHLFLFSPAPPTPGHPKAPPAPGRASTAAGVFISKKFQKEFKICEDRSSFCGYICR